MGQLGAILAVDDTKANLDILLNILNDFDVIPTTSGQKAIEIAKSEKIALILLDIVMPGMDGYEVCKILKLDPLTKDIPIIFITANTDDESIGAAYDVGGSDYISKPIQRKEVLARVKTQLNLRKNILELEYLASHDMMTGIYNRRKFFELAIPLFESSHGKLFAAMIDIDNFKSINDRYGHNIGDSAIKLVTKTIFERLPAQAVLGRMGGEEFAVVCGECQKEEIVSLFERIKDEIATLEIADKEERIKFTISIGISEQEESVRSLDELLKNADEALYGAKESGRNRVIFRQ
jgi:diguanylate cyclase (GGDEF)-like protein